MKQVLCSYLAQQGDLFPNMMPESSLWHKPFQKQITKAILKLEVVLQLECLIYVTYKHTTVVSYSLDLLITLITNYNLISVFLCSGEVHDYTINICTEDVKTL